MEIWKLVEEFPNYEVSSEGSVRSLSGIRQFGQNKRFFEGKIVKPRNNGNSYLYVSIWNGEKVCNRYIHRLVAKTFLQNPDEKKTVNHKDGNKGNNCVENLEWATFSENHLHKNRIIKTGNINSRAGRKLSKAEFDEILNKKGTYSEIGREHNLPAIRISRIKNGGRAIWV